MLCLWLKLVGFYFGYFYLRGWVEGMSFLVYSYGEKFGVVESKDRWFFEICFCFFCFWFFGRWEGWMLIFVSLVFNRLRRIGFLVRFREKRRRKDFWNSFGFDLEEKIIVFFGFGSFVLLVGGGEGSILETRRKWCLSKRSEIFLENKTFGLKFYFVNYCLLLCNELF